MRQGRVTGAVALYMTQGVIYGGVFPNDHGIGSKDLSSAECPLSIS